MTSRPLLAPRRVPRRFRRVSERFVEGNRVMLLRNGSEAFPAMLEAIAGARHQVLLEMYWFDSGNIGRRFAEALMQAARRGVNVAVIYDSLGSWEAEPEMFDQIAGAGARVIEFNPLMPWKKRFRLAKLSRRDHRKLLVVDSEIGFTGGINISDAWLPEDQDGQGWRDDCVRIQGPAVSGLVDCFMRTWKREGGAELDVPVVRRSGAQGLQHVRVLGEAFNRNRREIVRAYLYNIYRATRRVWITNSYFVPDRSVTRALKYAALRGVDVRVLLPGVSDIEIVRHASRAVWGGLMRYGVRIFEWNQNVLHGKTAVIDGRWSTIGTFNLDYRSLLWNLEVNVSVLDEGFAEVLEGSFLRDLADSREVDRHAFRFRSLGDRLLEAVAYRFRRLL